MKNPRKGFAFVLGLLAPILLTAAAASAQYADFSIAGGYSHMYPQRTGNLFFNKDGEYVDANLAFRVPQTTLPIYFGLGVSASGYYDSQDNPYLFQNNGNDFFGTTKLYSDVEDIELEPRLAVKLVIPGVPNFYIRPQIGAGLLVNDYSVDTSQQLSPGFTYIYTYNHTGAAFEVRPDIEAGFGWRRTSVGLDVSYMAAWGSFGQLGHQLQELRAGVFVRFKI
jgi:hypothetical protein